MKGQLEKSLLLEALTPLSSVRQCGSSPSHMKALQTNPNTQKRWLQAMPSYPNRCHCFGGLCKKQLLPTNILVALLAAHLVNGALQSKPK